MQLCRADMRGRWKFEDDEGSDAKVKTMAANARRRNTAWVSPFTPRLCIYGVVHSVWRLQTESIVAATFTALDDSFSLSIHITTRDIHSLVSISGLHNLPGLLHNCVKAINLPRDLELILSISRLELSEWPFHPKHTVPHHLHSRRTTPRHQAI